MRITVTLFYHQVNSVGVKKTFNGIHLRQCEDARLLAFDKSVFLWELNSKVFILNIQVDMATTKDLVML